MSDLSHAEDEPVGYALDRSGGPMRRLAGCLFWWVPRPVTAFGGRDLYLFRLRGHGFHFLVRGGSGHPINRFVTTRVVAAASIREAEVAAINSVVQEWRSNGWPGVPSIDTYDSELLSRRVWLYEPAGFTLFYVPEDQEESE